MLFVMGVTLYTSRVVLEQLGVTDYGIYNVVGSVVTIFTFISQALGNATNRFIVFSIGKGDVAHTKQVFNTCMMVHLAIAVLVTILIETVGLWFLNDRLNIPADRYSAAFYTFHISVAVCFLTIVRIPLTAEVIAHEHMGVYAVISVVETILKWVIAVVLAFCSFDKLIFYSILFFLVQLLVNLAYHVYCRMKYEECVMTLRVGHDRQLYQEIGSFAGWSMFGNITWLAYTQGINIMLNVFFGPAVNAARGVAVQVDAAVSSFVKSFQTALNPQITKSYAQHDLQRMHELMIYSSKFSFYLYLLFAIPIFFEADNLMKIWLVEVPGHTVNFVRLTLLMVLVNPIANPLGVSNDATGQIKWFQIVCSLISLQIVTISYLFLSWGYAPEVVFIINFLVMGVQTLAKLLFARVQVGLSLKAYFRSVIIRGSVVLLLSSVLSYMLFGLFSDGFLSVFLYLVCSACIVLVVSCFCGINRAERQMALETIRKKARKK
jgi:O-antigen/teichoic acid export membrane protein